MIVTQNGTEVKTWLCSDKSELDVSVLRTDWVSFGSTDQPYTDVNDRIFALMFTIQLITF